MKKIVIALVILIVGVVIFTNGSENETVQDDLNTQTQETNTQNEDTSPEVNDASGIYTEYAGNLSQYEGKDIILFFKASWCPSCRVLDSNIKENLKDVPEDVVLLELDYDKETDLKKQYGVTTQHTLVYVDSEGNMIKKWSGGNRLQDVLNQIR